MLLCALLAPCVAAQSATGDWEKYSEVRDAALKSDWRKLAEGFPGSPDLPVWTFLRGVAAFDPLPYWIQLPQPVLVLYGENDEHDNVPVKESVRRLDHAFGVAGKKNYRIKVIPGAGHAFIDPERQQLMPEFVDALGTWVEEFVVREVTYRMEAGHHRLVWARTLLRKN